jgi:hypothetical protein
MSVPLPEFVRILRVNGSAAFRPDETTCHPRGRIEIPEDIAKGEVVIHVLGAPTLRASSNRKVDKHAKYRAHM